MNKEVQKILDSKIRKEFKKNKLNTLISDANIALDILDGNYTYCETCKDYYLTESFLTKTEVKEENVCIYEDYINSGGNEYAMRKVHYEHKMCPKGHIVSTNRTKIERID